MPDKFTIKIEGDAESLVKASREGGEALQELGHQGATAVDPIVEAAERINVKYGEAQRLLEGLGSELEKVEKLLLSATGRLAEAAGGAVDALNALLENEKKLKAAAEDAGKAMAEGFDKGIERADALIGRLEAVEGHYEKTQRTTGEPEPGAEGPATGREPETPPQDDTRRRVKREEEAPPSQRAPGRRPANESAGPMPTAADLAAMGQLRSIGLRTGIKASDVAMLEHHLIHNADFMAGLAKTVAVLEARLKGMHNL